jgi:hypothetical protein
VIAGLTTPEEVIKVTPTEEVKEKMTYISYPAGGENTNPDQRIYERFPLRLNLRFRVIKSDMDLLKRGLNLEQYTVTKNISCGGILFAFEQPISVGSILEIKLELPDGEKELECLARVVRIEELEENVSYNIAICFLDLTPDQRVRLEKYLKDFKKI